MLASLLVDVEPDQEISLLRGNGAIFIAGGVVPEVEVAQVVIGNLGQQDVILPIAGKGSSDWGYAMVPVIGPCIGGVIAAFIYQACWL